MDIRRENGNVIGVTAIRSGRDSMSETTRAEVEEMIQAIEEKGWEVTDYDASEHPYGQIVGGGRASTVSVDIQAHKVVEE